MGKWADAAKAATIKKEEIKQVIVTSKPKVKAPKKPRQSKGPKKVIRKMDISKPEIYDDWRLNRKQSLRVIKSIDRELKSWRINQHKFYTKKGTKHQGGADWRELHELYLTLIHALGMTVDDNIDFTDFNAPIEEEN